MPHSLDGLGETHTVNTRKSNNFASKKKHRSVIFMDRLSKAFDSVKHFQFIGKLQLSEVTENYPKWLSSYLSDRCQYVEISHSIQYNYQSTIKLQAT